MTERDARSVYELREALECFAIRLFVARASDDEVDKLQAAVEATRAVYSSSGVSAMLSVKDEFYKVLYSATDNDVLWDQAKGLHHRIAQLRARSMSRNGRPAESIREIEQVMDLIRQRKSAEAEEGWRMHLRNAAQAALDDPDTLVDRRYFVKD
jgi:DNA-binding GntR family transcriptional regulator